VIVMNKVIGLTGGIATGKSAVSTFLGRKGIPIIDADIVAHQVQEPGENGLKAITAEFGQEVLASSGRLDRTRLGEIVFQHPQKLKRLVQVMDPFIREKIIHEIDRYRDKQLTVLDAPTLFENGYTYLTDSIVVVYCDPVTQMKRLRRRDDLTISQASARIKSQWSLQTKCDLADTIIYNSGSLENTNMQVEDWLQQEKKY